MKTKNDYLDIMGIQRWRSNFLLPGALDPVVSSTWILLNIETKIPSAILHIETLSSNDDQAEIDKLLDAMLTAVKLKRDALHDNAQTPQGLLQIIMGGMLAQKYLDSSESFDTLRANNAQRLKSDRPLLVTYHPQQLLVDPKLKRGAWEDLKGLLRK